MADWLCSGFIWLCVIFAIFQVIGRIWLGLYLYRHWRTVPELWCLDWADIVFRLERDFGVTLSSTDFEGLSPNARLALTAGQLWEMVAAKLSSAGTELPPDGWAQLVAVLSEALNVKPKRIVPESRLYADLGMIYGID